MKKHILPLLISILIFSHCSDESKDETSSSLLKRALKEDIDIPKNFAKASISDFRNLVNEQNYRLLGFESMNEVREMILGDPLLIYFVGLEDIRRFEQNDDPEKLLSQYDEIIYPVKAGDNIRSSVTVAKSGEDWQVTSFGRPKWTKAVSDIIKQKTATTNLSNSDYFIVNIPALYILLIGHYEQDGLLFTQVHDHDDLNFKTGEVGPAGDIIVRIQQQVKDFTGAIARSN